MKYRPPCLKQVVIAWLILACVALPLKVALSQPSPSAQTDPVSVLKNNGDDRLAKPVTVIGEQMYLGELLEELSKQSGVAVSAGDNDGAAGERVSVYLKDLPLQRVMDALWSLVSYQKAEWQWEVAGDAPAKYMYTLKRPSPARHLSETLAQAVQQDFENQAATLLQGLKMTPEEREKLAKTDPAAAKLLSSEKIRTGLSIFQDALSKDDQTAVLRGLKTVEVPVTSLSPAAQELVRVKTEKGGGGFSGKQNGVLVPLPPSSSVQLSTQHFSGNISPTLFILINGSGSGYIGGDPLNNQWVKKIGDGWMLPGDTPSNSAEKKEMPPVTAVSQAVPPQQEKQKESPLFAKLSAMAKSTPFCFMAHMPRDYSPPAGSVDKTNGDLLQNLSEDRPSMQHKWRSDILLLNPLNYFTENVEQERAPWLAVKKFRAARDADPQSLPSAASLIALARETTAAQWKGMGKEAEFGPLDAAARWHSLFLWMSKDPERQAQMLSDQGVVLGGVAAQVQQAAASNADLANLLGARKVIRIRFETQDVSPSEYSTEKPKPNAPIKPKRPLRFYRFLYLDRSHKWVRGSGDFFWEGALDPKNKASTP